MWTNDLLKGIMLAIRTQTRITLVPLSTFWSKFGYNTIHDVPLTNEQYEAFLSFYHHGTYNVLVTLRQALVALNIRGDLHEEIFHPYGRMREHSIPLTMTPYVVILRGTDGLGVLCHRTDDFAFLVDYMETYPDEQEISLPYSSEVIEAALRGRGTLKDSLNCLKHLNPARNSYYFDFDLSGMPVLELMALVHSLTVEERTEVIRCYEANKGSASDLPDYGSSWRILACFSSVREDDTLCTSLFSEYPCWLFCNLMRDRCHTRALTVLLTADFNKDIGKSTQQGVRYSDILRELIPLCKTWDEAAKVLAICGLRSKELLNEALVVSYPLSSFYDVELYAAPLLSSIYPGEWDAAFIVRASIELMEKMDALTH